MHPNLPFIASAGIHLLDAIKATFAEEIKRARAVRSYKACGDWYGKTQKKSNVKNDA